MTVLKNIREIFFMPRNFFLLLYKPRTVSDKNIYLFIFFLYRTKQKTAFNDFYLILNDYIIIICSSKKSIVYFIII